MCSCVTVVSLAAIFQMCGLGCFDTLAAHPELDAKFDIVKIFRHIARNSGAKNISDFERKQPPAQAKVAQDEDVMREVEAGNLVPA